MDRKAQTRWIAIGTLTLALVGGGTGIAMASGDDDGTDKPITGPALGKASAAALTHTGGGKVTQTEMGDEESFYEVEVTRPDGRHIDVQLDRDFTVVGSHSDHDDPTDTD